MAAMQQVEAHDSCSTVEHVEQRARVSMAANHAGSTRQVAVSVQCCSLCVFSTCFVEHNGL